MVKNIASDFIVFAMKNTIPKIMSDVAKAAEACIIFTGRSDFQKQINNCLNISIIFKGTLKIRARKINNNMKLAAANALASCILEDD